MDEALEQMSTWVLHWASVRVRKLLGVWDSFERGRGKAHAHRVQAFYHIVHWPLNQLLPSRFSQSGKVQGGGLLLGDHGNPRLPSQAHHSPIDSASIFVPIPLVLPQVLLLALHCP